MHVVAPASRLRRGVRRFALSICVLIMAAGFSLVLTSTVEPPAPPAAVSLAQRPSTVDHAAVVEPGADAPPAIADPAVIPVISVLHGPRLLPGGRHVGAVAGRAPPSTST
jgi:hypothetical protein